jgi:hypothetical protein
MDLTTTDGDPAYEWAMLDAYGEAVTPTRTGKRGGPGPATRPLWAHALRARRSYVVGS